MLRTEGVRAAAGMFTVSDVQQLTDNQWEEGTSAWQPTEATR